MNRSIPENIIEEIRARTDIVEVVSEVVLLKKSGKNHKGLCPFHAEKTPSFTVSPDKQIYHCFGCGAGGNVFKFLMETRSLSFIEVLKILAPRASVTLPSPARSGQQEKAHRERERLLQINRWTADYFQQALKHPVAGKAAREYIESRDIEDRIVEEYQLGWAPPGWRNLITAAGRKRDVSRQELEKAGLIVKKENGTDHYDRFRARILFPLKDLYGYTVGFAGRVIDEGQPKYMNSPETELYKKSRILFGLDKAREAIRRENRVCIFEGYFDQIRAAQHGIRHTVATCGTALTPAQASLLKNHTDHAVLVFDADAAGQTAAQRGFDVLFEHGMKVSVIVLPNGHDPDSYIRQFGPESFLKQIENARPFIESNIENAIANGDVRTPSGRMEIVNQVLPLLLKVKNPLEQTEWVRYFSDRVGVEDKALHQQVKQALSQNRKTVAAPAQPARSKQDPELYLVHLMLADKEIAGIVQNRIALDEFSDQQLRTVAGMIYELLDKGQPVQIDRLVDRTERPEIKTLLTRIGMQPIAFEKPDQAADDCLRGMRKRNLEAKIKELKRQRSEAEKAGESERSREIHSRLRELQMTVSPG